MRKLYFFILNLFLNPLLRAEKRYPRVVTERLSEYEFVIRHVREKCTGKILDVGTGPSSFPHLLQFSGYNVTCIDKKNSFWKYFFNRHIEVIDDDICYPKHADKYQIITCISTFEHIPDWKRALTQMSLMLEKGGYLIMTFPYNRVTSMPDVYEGKENFTTKVFNASEIEVMEEYASLKVEDMMLFDCFTGELWGQGERCIPRLALPQDKHHLACVVFKSI